MPTRPLVNGDTRSGKHCVALETQQCLTQTLETLPFSVNSRYRPSQDLEPRAWSPSQSEPLMVS